ncbi:MAG: radical SAM protein [Desulfobacterales bacterium CG2_30_60_27]|nr:MAG: radical SAM protein [Desulfobacterales bacterium CG2_30_60_27]
MPPKASRHPDTIPCLVYANDRGEIIDFPDLNMAGRGGAFCGVPDLADLIPLPEGSELFLLPQRKPMGIQPRTGKLVTLEKNPLAPRAGIQAVAAFMAPAHTVTLTAAFKKDQVELAPLPLFAYAAVGWHRGRFWAAGFRSDPDTRQEFAHVNPDTIEQRTRQRMQECPDNRLIQHLGKCSLTYGCPAAKNYFLGRFEAPLPTSPACNAACLGCISLQPSGCCPATQDRIRFVPSAAEITEVAVPHLQQAKRPVVSFGQGCEGEPLLQAETIGAAIRAIRKQTSRGTINLNSNASRPEAVALLAAAGLDSIRVSMNSARPEKHRLYYRPTGFGFTEVMESISIMKKQGKWVSLNYFILPGFTDDPEEFAALCDLVAARKPDLIQLRNLNMDPDWYLEEMGHHPIVKPMGIRHWLAELKKRFPALRFGYFNPPLG